MSGDVIRRVAVVPHPPLLVPDLVPGSEEDTAAVRTAALDAVRELAADSGRWLAVGTHQGGRRSFGPEASGTFAGYGVDVPVALSAHASDEQFDLPLPVLVAGWLRAQAGARAVRVELVPASLAPGECTALGRELAESAAETALLVLGDGSTRHGPRAPGRFDERAPGFDDAVARALGSADLDGLEGIDPALADDLGAVGRASWQVLAGLARGASWHPELRYTGAPLGVGYHVAVWERR